MKKYFQILTLPVICLLFSIAGQAQVTTKFGPEVGFAASGLYDNYSEEVKAGITFQGGGTAHIQFGRFFAVRPSVLVKYGRLVDSEDLETFTSLTRISVPVAVLFSYNFKNDNQVYVGAGPNLMYSLAGKSNDNYDYVERKINFGSGAEDDMKPLDFGLHFKAGFNFNRGASVGIFVNAGLSNLYPQADDTRELKTLDAIGFSFAWLFGGNAED
jgi:hypothetical protein